MNKDDTIKNKPEAGKAWTALSLSWQLGYSIAIPLVALALLGRILDKKFGTSPWLLLGGILISLVISTVIVYYKTISIIGISEDKKDKF